MRRWQFDEEALSEPRATPLSEAEYAEVERFELHKRPWSPITDVAGLRFGIGLVLWFAIAVGLGLVVLGLDLILSVFR